MMKFCVLVILSICMCSGNVFSKEYPDVKGKFNTIGLDRNKNILSIQAYWRSNILIDSTKTTRKKKDKAQHVPGLIEFKLNSENSGIYEFEINSEGNDAQIMNVHLDGDLVFNLIPNSGNNKFSVEMSKGVHYLRFISPKVHTELPIITNIECEFVKKKRIKNKGSKIKKLNSNGMKPGWYNDMSRKIHLDFHTAGFVENIGNKWNPDEFAATLEDNGFNAVTIFAKGHHGYAYYNTKIGTRHPGLDFDLMKEQIESCHNRGIKVLIYFSIQVDELWGSTEEGENRNWVKFMDVDANPVKAYVKDYTWPMIREVIENYDIDGFWFDFPGYDSFVTETIDLIKSINPNLPSAYNHQFDKSREVLSKQDLMELEAWEHGQSLYRWSYLSRYAHGSTPLIGMTTRFWKNWGDFGTVNTEAMFQYETALAYANGCGITIGDQLHPNGKLEPAVYKRMKKAMDMGKIIEPYVNDAVFEPYVAVLRQSTKLIPVVIDNSWHYNVVDTTQNLNTYKIVLVPDASKVDDEYVNKLESFVRNGGKLVVCGNPSTKLASLLGVKVSEEKPEAAYIRNRSDALADVIEMDLFIREKIVAVKTNQNTENIAPMVWQMNHGTNHLMSHKQSPPMDESSDYAAITKRNLEKGTIIFSPAPLFHQYAEDGNSEVRKIVKNMFEIALKPSGRLIEVSGDVNLEVSVMRNDNKNIIQLIHCPQARRSSLDTQPVIEEFPTVRAQTLKLNKDFVGDRKLKVLTDVLEELKPIKECKNQLIFELPDFKINIFLILE